MKRKTRPDQLNGVELEAEQRFSTEILNRGILSDELSITRNWVIRIKRTEARREESQYKEIDLRKIRLPPNGLYTKSLCLVHRPDLVAALRYGIDAFIIRSTKSIGRTRRIGGYVNDILLFYEALWLRDITTIDAMRPEHFVDLARDLGKGWWPFVLSLHDRAEDAGIGLQDFERPRSAAYIRELLATNYWHVKGYLKEILDEEVADVSDFDSSGDPEQSQTIESEARILNGSDANSRKGKEIDTTEGKLSSSRLATLFRAANFLYEAKDGYGLKFCPYPDSFKLAATLGMPAGRTNNLSIGFAGRLFRVCLIWLYERAPALLAFLEKITAAVEQSAGQSEKTITEKTAMALLKSEEYKNLASVLPFSLNSLDSRYRSSSQFTFRSSVTCLLAACFVLIAFMNARRKGEVVDKKIGLMCGALSVHNEQLGLYQVDFYIEKSYQRRLPYYVNDTTCLAIRTLEAIQRCFRRVDEAWGAPFAKIPDEEIPLFSYRRFNPVHGIGLVPKWFDFSEYSRERLRIDSTNIIREAGGEEGYIFGETQVFRRMYCLIFYYRYENSDIIAVDHQLGHQDLRSTRVYLTDPLSRQDTESIYASMPTEAEDRRRAFMAEDSDLAKEMQLAGERKLAEDVYEVLAGKPFSGGFAKYLRRLQTSFSALASFEDVDLDDAVFQAVKRRGHFPRPLPHGECMLGSAPSRSSARCYSRTDNMTHFERASPRCAIVVGITLPTLRIFRIFVPMRHSCGGKFLALAMTALLSNANAVNCRHLTKR
ncbi:hypothetical protein NDK50_01535 [Paraburkholderia bryophila]|uniref:hypothetical protein n=1 Tax=Paraburkholderia bryophila TaxID=420952 RepID=UPI00234B4C29|nr:hypothetical protein [Paraburkholderia bryophila]WCM20188.1 hypothetical protein NDK50_01535 [Paraburkholderia bryophila]